MMRRFTLEYWKDEGWYVGRLKQLPSIFSQGKTLSELEGNIRDAYQWMKEHDTEVFAIRTETETPALA